MVHHAGYPSHLKRKIRTVLHLIAQNFSHQLATNFPGLTYVSPVKGVRCLPIPIKTHFEHASEGNVTAYAILWFTDSSSATSVSESIHGDPFEYFFYAADGRRHRSLFIHEIIAVEPSSGVLSAFVGKWFSSFNNSQRALGSSALGWLNWLTLDDEELSMATIARTVGFRNHPEILDSQLEDLTEVEMPWDPIADSEVTDDPDAADIPVRTGPAIVRAYPDSWPMRWRACAIMNAIPSTATRVQQSSISNCAIELSTILSLRSSRWRPRKVITRLTNVSWIARLKRTIAASVRSRHLECTCTDRCPPS